MGRPARTLAGIGVFVVIALFSAEVALRLLPPGLVGDLGPARINIEFHDFGPWFVPDQRTSFTTPCHSAAPISINSFGMRDEARRLAKASDTVRVSILGDSFMEALQVADGKTTAALLQERLDRRSRPVEVLNFGFSGYGTAQQLHLYRAKVRQFKSDYVLVFFLPGNDVQNNSMKLDYAANGLALEDYGKSGTLPFAYFDLVGNDLIARPNIWVNTPLKRFVKKYLLHKSYLVDYLYGRFLYLRAYAANLSLRAVPKADPARARQTEPAAEPNGKRNGNSSSEARDWEEAWMLTELIFRTFRQEVEADDAQLGVVIIDQDDEKYRRMIALAKKLGLPVLALKEPLEQLRRRDGLAGNALIFAGCDSHWSANGHRLAAEATAAWLEPILDAGGFE